VLDTLKKMVRFWWLYPALFCLLSAAILGAGRFYIHHTRESALRTALDELRHIADFKAEQVARWREVRLNIANTLVINPAVAQWLDRLVQDPSNATIRAEVFLWMQKMEGRFGYGDAALVSASGQVVLAVKPDADLLLPPVREALAEADQTGLPQLSDLYLTTNTQPARMVLAVPFAPPTAPAGSPCSCRLLIRINPYQYLFKLLKMWPVPSASGEILLVRREPDAAVVLNELRFGEGTALQLRVPLANTQRPCAQAVLGQREMADGVDYRGERVLAAITAVPKSPWFLVAKQNRKEVLAGLAGVDRLTWAAMAGAIVCVGLLLGLLAFSAWLHTVRREGEWAAEFRRLFDHVGDVVFVKNVDGQILMANTTAVERYGYSQEEWKQIRTPDLFAPEELARLPAVQQTLAREGQVVFETVHVRKDGQRMPVEVNVRRTTFRGEPAEVGVIRDITARKYGEEQLRLQSAALSAAANGIVITDHAGKVIWANSAFSAMTGYELGEVQGKTLDLLRSNQHPPEYYAQLAAAFRDGTVWSGELVNRRKDGRLFTDTTTVTPVRNSAGEVTHFIEINQDVTEQRALQQQYLQAQKMESIGRLAAGIAHDFNNQLQGILGFSDLLRRSMPEEDERRADVDEIRKAAYAAANLTRQLMAFGRRQALDMQVLDINRLINDGHKMYQRLFGEDIAFRLELEPDIERIRADPGQLDQVLMNLFINARDAMPNGGSVTISTANTTLGARDVGQWTDARPGRFVVLAIADTGMGMPPEVRAHIFEPFFTTKSKHQGTGLGLATVYGLAQQHGGWVHVYSEVGQGSTFKVYIPAFASTEASVVAPGPVVSEPYLAGHGQRVLLVEDEAGVRELALRILRQNNYIVTAAGSVGEALKLHAEAPAPFELLLSDVVLPDGNGLELVEQLLVKQPGLRVVMASGYTDERSRWPAIQARGLRFIPKPYPAAALLRLLHEVLLAPQLKA
jgi:PAS domain S-box-containing protein